MGGESTINTTILKTSNGGNVWNPQTANTSNHLHGIVAASSAVAWAVGNVGMILKTTDGGATWVAQSVGTATLHEIAFVPPATLWVVGTGDTILKSVDGGITWSGQATGAGQNLHGIAALDGNTAYAVGDPGIFKTTNGGATWTRVLSGLYKSIAVVNASTALAVELFGQVARTADGGANWTAMPTGSPGFLFRIAAVSATTAWVVGDGGRILRTMDAGATWTSEPTPTTNTLFGIVAVGSNATWAVGDFGTILHSGPPPVRNVTIDIKPGSDPNSVNCRDGRGVITVAILSVSGFNATLVDSGSVRFGRNGTEATETHGKGHLEDVDGDGNPDMVFHFRFGETGIQCGDTVGILTGKTTQGEPFVGRDNIRTVP